MHITIDGNAASAVFCFPPFLGYCKVTTGLKVVMPCDMLTPAETDTSKSNYVNHMCPDVQSLYEKTDLTLTIIEMLSGVTCQQIRHLCILLMLVL